MCSRLMVGSFSLGTGLVAILLAMIAPTSGQKAAADPASDGYWQLEKVDSTAGESLSTNCYQTNASGGPGSITFTSRYVCGGEWNGTSKGNWSAPPERLVPGTRMEMTLSGRATASNNGITQGLVLSAGFNAAPCKYARNAVNIAELSLVSHDPARQTGQITGSAVVPGKGWASDVSELGGRLKLNVCAPGWVTYYHYRWVPGASTGGSGPATVPPTVGAGSGTAFVNPRINGMGVDNCATFAGNCGQGGADLFCRSKGYERANSFELARMKPTLVLGDRRVCDNDTCVGLSRVVCTGRGTTQGGGGPGGLTYSKWDSFTPHPGQFAGQPARFFPLRVLGDPYFVTGRYDVFIANADPDGRRISTWRLFSQVTLGDREKWGATFYDRPQPHDLYLEKDAVGLLTFSIPTAGHAMIYAANADRRHWRAICVLPSGSGMTVRADCFHGSKNIIYVSPSGASSEGPVVTSMASPPRVLFNNNNPAGVGSNPARETIVDLAQPTVIAKITTYHWNSGHGTQAPGTIGLRNSSGRVYGPWSTIGTSGQGGVANAYWVATPNEEVPAGSYTVIDSEPATWAHNPESGNAGIAWLEGIPR